MFLIHQFISVEKYGNNDTKMNEFQATWKKSERERVKADPFGIDLFVTNSVFFSVQSVSAQSEWKLTSSEQALFQTKSLFTTASLSTLAAD